MSDAETAVREAARVMGLAQNDPRVTEAVNLARIAVEDGRGDLVLELARGVLQKGVTPTAA